MLLVGNGTVLTMGPKPRVIEQGAVLVEGEKIRRVGGTAELRAFYPEASYLDAGGKLIMPGFINAHAHLYGSCGISRQAPDATGRKLGQGLSLAGTYYSALLHLIEGIKHGVTTVIAHHSSPGAPRGSLPALAKAAGDTGVRACFCYEVSDRHGDKETLEGILENASFLLSCQESANSLRGLFGIHPCLSDESLRNCRTVAEKFQAGFHFHAGAEGEDGKECRGTQHRGPLERLASFGILGPATIGAHLTPLSQRELDLLQQSGTWVVYNPQLGSSTESVPLRELLAREIGITLGTDIYANDMLSGTRMLQQYPGGSAAAVTADLAAVLCLNNSRLASGLFGGVLGELAPGAWADIIIADYQAPGRVDAFNWQSRIFNGITGNCVHTTIVNGEVKLLAGRLVELDEEEVNALAREYAGKLRSENSSDFLGHPLT